MQRRSSVVSDIQCAIWQTVICTGHGNARLLFLMFLHKEPIVNLEWKNVQVSLVGRKFFTKIGMTQNVCVKEQRNVQCLEVAERNLEGMVMAQVQKYAVFEPFSIEEAKRIGTCFVSKEKDVAIRQDRVVDRDQFSLIILGPCLGLKKRERPLCKTW